MTVEKKESDFAELLKSLQEVADGTDELAKAQPAEADDKKVAAAAAEGEGEGNPEDEEDDGEGEAFGKSVAATDAAGNPIEAVDATDLIKSLIERLDTNEGTLAKSVTTLTGIVGKQNDLIKSLQGQVKELASQGRGRRTMVTIAEKPGAAGTLTKSQDAEDRITPEQLMAKANSAWDAKKITGAELSIIDSCIRQREPINPALLQKIALA